MFMTRIPSENFDVSVIRPVLLSRKVDLPPFDSRSASGKHYTKPRFAAHHALVSFVGTLQRIALIHRANSSQHAKLERVLRILRRAGVPALHRTPAHKQYK